MHIYQLWSLFFAPEMSLFFIFFSLEVFTNIEQWSFQTKIRKQKFVLSITWLSLNSSGETTGLFSFSNLIFHHLFGLLTKMRLINNIKVISIINSVISLNLEELCEQHYGRVHPSRHPQDEFRSHTCIILAAESYNLTYTPKLTEKNCIKLGQI